ncbi:hypothetical protein Tco_0462138 [Tanacetum coccineum]
MPILNVADEAVFKEWDDRVVRATTTAASLDAAHTSVNTLGSDEGSVTLLELTILCTTLSKKMESFEADLKQTKKVYGAAYTKLIKKVKKLEKTVKSNKAKRRAKIVDNSQEDQPEDQLGVLSAAKVLADAAKKNANTYTRRRRAVSTGNGEVSTVSRLFSTAEESVSTDGASMPVSTAGMVQEVNISIPSPVVVKDKGKGIMTDSKDEQTKRTKLHQEQDRLRHEAAVRLQEELDEEERQRMAGVHAAAQSFTKEEWENIRARVEANEELTQRIQPEERNKYNEVDQANMLVDLINQRKRYFAAQKVEAKRNKPMTQTQQRNYMMNYIKHMGSSKKQKTNEALELVQEQPDEEEKELPQEDLQQMMMVASDDLRDALFVIYLIFAHSRRSVSIRCQGYIGDFVLGSHAKDMVVLLVMSADSAVTYTSVHSEARSWSIPSEDPYEEAARQLLEQAPRSPEYIPVPMELEDHVPVYILEPEHPEDLVPAEDEAPTPLLPPFFLSPRIRPPHTRATMRQMRAAAPSTYHSVLPSETPPLLPIPLHISS